jgi:UDP-N-acetylmuramoyl-tripeptide--D-alanyl-D-alanine ligase
MRGGFFYLYIPMETADLYELYSRYPCVVTDSRSTVPGSIFFALRGDRFNGNAFAGQALEGGARFAVVDDPSFARDERYILVDDSLRSLQELSAYHRKRMEIPIVAITGSNGKTTTKELAAEILSSRYLVTATSGNLNNHIGVPLTLLRMDESTEIGIVEMGANHTGEIAMLCNLARPDYGLITNIGLAHLEGFGDIEGVKKAKGELYRYLAENGGLIFCNANDGILLEMLRGLDAGIRFYGRGKDVLCSGEVVSTDPYLEVRVGLRRLEEFNVVTRLTGMYNLENILAAVALGMHFRIPPEKIQSVLRDWSTDNNRSQRIETDNNILIMDAYNANPTSMRAALDNFRLQDHPHKALILGDMLELGREETAAHREILELVESMDCGEVFLVGPVFSSLNVPGHIRRYASAVELAGWLQSNPLSDRLILIKASRGIGLERLRDNL